MTKPLVIVAISAAIIFIIVGLVYVFRRFMRNKEHTNNIEAFSMDPSDPNCRVYNYSALRKATKNFSDEIGKGGFGVVYKGVFETGHMVAVKKLHIESSQEDAEFKKEVSMLVNLQHRNLVRLLGYGIKRKERLVVFEYMPNSSLDTVISDPEKREVLDWIARKDMIKGICKAIRYIHEDSRSPILHCDLKPANILLDSQFNPIVADFGCARFFNHEDSRMLRTRHLAGTTTYMAPDRICYARRVFHQIGCLRCWFNNI